MKLNILEEKKMAEKKIFLSIRPLGVLFGSTGGYCVSWRELKY